jgi:drug/metabolite transporter (DMT)-like permease
LLRSTSTARSLRLNTIALTVGAAGTDAVGAGRISSVVLVAVLVAACAHAGWNAIAHGITDKFVSIALVNAGCLICAVPLVIFAVAPQRASWGYLAASVVIHVAYNCALMLSYRLGDFSQTYPLARGTSPLVVVGLAAVFAGEVPTPGELIGVALICGGLAALVFYGRRSQPIHGSAVAAAVGTGLLIAAYTVVDGLGIRQAGSWVGYVAWLMFLESLFIPVAAVVMRRRRLLDDLSGVWHIGLVGGALSIVAYGLVLWAQTRAPLAPVAALRESSIVIAAIIGTLVFGERFGAARVMTTLCVAAGIATLYLL